MLITRKFLRSFFCISAVFLLLMGGATSFLLWSKFQASIQQSLEAEAENVAVVAMHEYGLGDLVTLRSSLTWLASGRGWVVGELTATTGDTIWRYPNATAGEGRTQLSGTSSATLSVGVPVGDRKSGLQIGTLTIVKDISTEQSRFNFEMASIAIGIIGFWASFFGIIWYLGERAFRPLSTMSQAIQSRARKLALPLTSGAGADEGTLITNWFDELSDAWEEANRVAIANERLAAVARMTQMLAHDVRKPFSILRMGLGMLGGAKDPTAVKGILSRLVPEIDKAVSSVDGLIADVMEIGSTSTQLIQEPASPESLIEAAICETFRVYPRSDIALAYRFMHTHMVNVHVQKVGRIFSNIIGNAVQAMNLKGRIWFTTRELDGKVEFCLGNSDSAIPAENLPKLFDAFFTSGKKGGTGLGLAIAQKVVMAHGGRIWCESSQTPEHPTGKVEFFFTLPVAEGHPCKSTALLPRHSSEISSALEAIAFTASECSLEKGEATLEADVNQASEHLGRPLQVLVVDDEAVYRNALAAYLGRTPEISKSVSVSCASNIHEALATVSNRAFDLVITDVDLGEVAQNGFDLVRELRRLGVTALMCIHSNRICPADHQTAIESGADAFLPKPLARAQLLRLVLQAAAKSQVLVESTEAVAFPVPRMGAMAAGKPEVLVIDDNPFILDAWMDTLKPEATVHVMTSFEALKARVQADPGFLGRLVCVVTDMHLDGSAGNGLDVGHLVKGARPELCVLLSSDGLFDGIDVAGAVDRIIAKDPVPFAQLPVTDAP